MENVILECLKNSVQGNRNNIMKLIDHIIKDYDNVDPVKQTSWIIDPDDDILVINDLNVSSIVCEYSTSENDIANNYKDGYITYVQNRFKSYFSELTTEDLLKIYEYLVKSNQ
jgi:hypothetical protein